MLNFSHVTHPLWGGIMGQYPSARAAAYADDGFVRDTLLTVLRILAALKHAFKEDLEMELTLPTCKVLIPGLSQEDDHDAIRSVVSSHDELSSLRDMISEEALACHLVGDRHMTIQDVVKVDGLTCVGVPIGTSDFMVSWAEAKLRDQIDQGFATALTDVGSSDSLPFGALLWPRQAWIHVSHSSSRTHA